MNIVSFYNSITPDYAGRYLPNILNMGDTWFERVHDFIQVLFPNREPSVINPEAPLLTDEIVEEFRSRPELTANVKRSLNRMIMFYQMDDEHPWWCIKGNHNYLRITRILNTLREFEMRDELLYFYEKLLIIYENNSVDIGELTWEYWENAFYGADINE